MARTPSTMVDLGTPAPDFALPDTHGRTVALGNFSEKPILVAFICNHCPFVKLIRTAFASFCEEYREKGLGIVAIMPNDVVNYPDDSPEKMGEEARDSGYTFPYLYDETQDVAKAYRAACTPDFFLYDTSHCLVYRGQFDASRPGNEVIPDGRDLRAAADAILSGGTVTTEQIPSIGCNIKWRKGNEPDYYGP